MRRQTEASGANPPSIVSKSLPEAGLARRDRGLISARRYAHLCRPRWNRMSDEVHTDVRRRLDRLARASMPLCAAATQDPLWIATRSFPSAAFTLSLSYLSGCPSGAQALLIPSSAEGYGLPIVEALAAGVPVCG